jgi:rod shape-determining protein MreD
LSNAVRVAAIVFVAALLQVTLISSLEVFGGTPDLLLVALVAIALLQGSMAGAAAGFAGGLLVDIATLGALGVSSLLLTVAGYWAGRYGETTGRDRTHAPFLAVGTITVLALVGGFLLHFMLGAELSARRAFVEALPPTVVLDLLICAPVYAACRVLLRPTAAPERVREVELYV